MKNLIRNATEPLAGSGPGDHLGFLPSREFRCWKSTPRGGSAVWGEVPQQVTTFDPYAIPLESSHCRFLRANIQALLQDRVSRFIKSKFSINVT